MLVVVLEWVNDDYPKRKCGSWCFAMIFLKKMFIKQLEKATTKCCEKIFRTFALPRIECKQWHRCHRQQIFPRIGNRSIKKDTFSSQNSSVRAWLDTTSLLFVINQNSRQVPKPLSISIFVVCLVILHNYRRGNKNNLNAKISSVLTVWRLILFWGLC